MHELCDLTACIGKISGEKSSSAACLSSETPLGGYSSHVCEATLKVSCLVLNEPLQRAFSLLKWAAVLPDGHEEQAGFSFEEI